MNDRFFVISSTAPVQKDRLFGYAFAGADIVLGDEGRREYEHRRGQNLPAGLDGSYVLIRQTSSGLELETDLNGYGKLFVYRSGRYWAVSNSLFMLVQNARAAGEPITLDLAHLSSFFAENTIGAQLLSPRTAVREIELVPSEKYVRIEASDLLVRARPIAPQGGASETYQSALTDFLTTWVSRMVTVIRSPARSVCDITGGLDSRAVLAMLLVAGELVGDPIVSKVYFNSNSAQKADFEVAKKLATTTGVSLGGGTNLFSNRRPTAEGAYLNWKRWYLGSYALLFMPNLDSPRDMFWLGGEGGEAIRTFYSSKTAADLFSRVANSQMQTHLAQRLVSEARADLTALLAEAKDGRDAGRVHYRQFRERLHGGRRSDFVNAVSPLGGHQAKEMAGLVDRSYADNGQIIRDIIANTTPDLLLEPFDDPRKPFGERALERCQRVDPWKDKVETDGVVFGYAKTEPRRVEGGSKKFLQLMLEDFHTVRSRAAALGIFSKDYLEEAETALSEAADKGRFANITQSRAAGHVLFAGLLARESTGQVD